MSLGGLSHLSAIPKMLSVLIRAKNGGLCRPSRKERNGFIIMGLILKSHGTGIAMRTRVLVSLLNNGGKDIAYVQNTETNEVQKVTKDLKVNNLRLVEIDRNTDPQKVEVVFAIGAEQETVN